MSPPTKILVGIRPRIPGGVDAYVPRAPRDGGGGHQRGESKI